jgi:hypothetical protein
MDAALAVVSNGCLNLSGKEVDSFPKLWQLAFKLQQNPVEG